MAEKIDVEFIENFLVVWNPSSGSELYRKGFYGKPLGIAKPKTPEFNVPLILDMMEGLYLSQKRMITVHEGSERKKVSIRKLQQMAKRLYEEFEEKYAVYRDLRDKGLIVTPGIKFGCDFAVYKYGPGVEHAPYMVSVKKTESAITATEIVKAGRLATTVRKRFIIAVSDLEKGRIDYLIFKWFKA
ncbi:tRNA-intron lyase [Candidatus Bathyarchaeota archaeon]|jgi:tRNA-intron endonuclease|nr:tRNA-intron lyase [Candidatus Bathyarchaeota archaeon]